MNNQWKKVIVPFLVVLGLIFFIARIVILLLRTNPLPPFAIMTLGLVLPSTVTVIFIVMLVERIREIKHGEEDALGNY